MDNMKSSKITAVLDPTELDRFDAYCESQGVRKSTLIARLIRNHLDEARFQVQRPRLARGGS